MQYFSFLIIVFLFRQNNPNHSRRTNFFHLVKIHFQSVNKCTIRKYTNIVQSRFEVQLCLRRSCIMAIIPASGAVKVTRG